MSLKINKGEAGELSAINYIKEKGYIIAERNYHSRYGEIDIIAKKDSLYVFIEVKYRKNTSYGYPREFVDGRKQDKIRKTALTFISENNLPDGDFRFDVLEITGSFSNIEHIENAF